MRFSLRRWVSAVRAGRRKNLRVRQVEAVEHLASSLDKLIAAVDYLAVCIVEKH